MENFSHFHPYTDHDALHVAKSKKQKTCDDLSSTSNAPPVPTTFTTDINLTLQQSRQQKARKSFVNEIPIEQMSIPPTPLIEIKQDAKLPDNVMKEEETVLITVPSDPMIAIQNEMIDQSTHQMTECIRSSFRSTLLTFRDMDVALLGNRVLQQECDDLRIKNNLLVSENSALQTVNNELVQKIDALIAENKKLKDDLQMDGKKWCSTCDVTHSWYFCSKPCEEFA